MTLGDLGRVVRRYWWIPVLLVVAGAATGTAMSSSVPAIFRAQATVLVGPTDGSVTHTSTIRTSEDLAGFYADMARRQIVLEPVVERVGLPITWDDLRNGVSAQVPAQNLRLVTVTVAGDSQSEADAVAEALVEELVALSPATPGRSDEAFVNEQAAVLQKDIVRGQEELADLRAELTSTFLPERSRQLAREIDKVEEQIDSWQRTYVELIAAEPSSGAGGLQILDHASAVHDLGRSGPAKQALVGGAVGGTLGLVLAWLIHRHPASKVPIPSIAERRPSRDVRRNGAAAADPGRLPALLNGATPPIPSARRTANRGAGKSRR